MQPFQAIHCSRNIYIKIYVPMGRLDACIWFRRPYAVAAEIGFECGIRNICPQSLECDRLFETLLSEWRSCCCATGFRPIANCPQRRIWLRMRPYYHDRDRSHYIARISSMISKITRGISLLTDGDSLRFHWSAAIFFQDRSVVAYWECLQPSPTCLVKLIYLIVLKRMQELSCHLHCFSSW